MNMSEMQDVLLILELERDRIQRRTNFLEHELTALRLKKVQHKKRLHVLDHLNAKISEHLAEKTRLIASLDVVLDGIARYTESLKHSPCD